ncbi:MAG: DUF6130 family protein [Nitrospira sp.]
MKLMWIAVLMVASTLAPIVSARGESGDVKIFWPPADGQVRAGVENLLVYDATPGPNGSHLHVWVDDQRGPGVRNWDGTYDLPGLNPGEHVITIKVVDKEHRPTGVEKSIRIIAQ